MCQGEGVGYRGYKTVRGRGQGIRDRVRGTGVRGDQVH